MRKGSQEAVPYLCTVSNGLGEPVSWIERTVFPEFSSISTAMLFLSVFLLLMVSFTSAYATYDSQKPTIDVSSVEINKERATIGDEITVAITITDNVAVTSAFVEFWSPDAGKMVKSQALSYSESLDKWTCSYVVNEHTPNGLLQISWIDAYDAENNHSQLSPFINVATIYGAADSQKPIVDLSSVIINRDTATVGDDITISLIISDNVAVTRASVEFWNGDAGKIVKTQSLVHNEGTGKWECSYRVTNNTPNGMLPIMLLLFNIIDVIDDVVEP